MTPAHAPRTAPPGAHPVGLAVMAMPALLLLRAELLALERMLPGHSAPQDTTDDASFEAQTDNLPV